MYFFRVLNLSKANLKLQANGKAKIEYASIIGRQL